jgi:hypothetical protein
VGHSRRPPRPVFILIAAVLLALGTALVWRAPAARAEPAAAYSISWYTVDGGGGTSAGASGYSLTGTAGQPDAGILRASPYTLGGGFWPSLTQALRELFLPLVRR